MRKLDLKSAISNLKTSTGKKTYGFPRFIDAQFWTFHIMDFAVRNGFHLIIDKTRRGGFSYIMAADSSNDINLKNNNPNAECQSNDISKNISPKIFHSFIIGINPDFFSEIIFYCFINLFIYITIS